MHPRLTVSQASTIQWSLEQDLTFYRKTGIGSVALLLRKLEPVGVDLAVERIRESGVRVDNFAIGPVFDPGKREQWPSGRAKLHEAFALAKRLATDCVVITTGPLGTLEWEAAADGFAEAIAPALAAAREAGITLAVEHTNGLRFDISFLHNLRDTVELAERVGFAICVEVNNIWGERGLAGTIERAVAHIRMVQVNDFVVGTLQTPDRAVPGDGDIPLERILGYLLRSGYRGPFELEIVGPRIESEGYASAVRRSLEYLTGLLDRLAGASKPRAQ